MSLPITEHYVYNRFQLGNGSSENYQYGAAYPVNAFLKQPVIVGGNNINPDMASINRVIGGGNYGLPAGLVVNNKSGGGQVYKPDEDPKLVSASVYDELLNKVTEKNREEKKITQKKRK